MKVLVVEDDKDTQDLVAVCMRLRWPDAEVVAAMTGEQGMALVEGAAPDLVILDIGLPDVDGRELLRKMRQFSDVPVIMLTAYDRDFDVASALEGGADDYVTKPFSSLELLARIQAVMRRAQGRRQTGRGPLVANDLMLDFDAAEVYKNGERIQLTPTELRILEHLARNSMRLVTYQALASRAVGVDDPGPEESRLIRVHVQHLRSKLGDSASNPVFIANVRGLGYKFMVPVTSHSAAPQA